MTSEPPALRRLALAVAVLHDVDLLPQADGILLTGAGAQRDIHVGWATVVSVVTTARAAATSAAQPFGERREVEVLADWLMARRALDPAARVSEDQLAVLGMPIRHVSHPGRPWTRRVVAGGALTLGFAYGDPGVRRPVPAGVLEHAGLDVDDAWAIACARLEEIGSAAAQRDRRHNHGPITPMAGTDVVTLLGARSLRAELAAGENDGLAALIVPLRTRGWRADSVSDPAYGPALAAAMPAVERGFDRPLLVTADEVSEVRAGGDPMRLLRNHDAI